MASFLLVWLARPCEVVAFGSFYRLQRAMRSSRQSESYRQSSGIITSEAFVIIIVIVIIIIIIIFFSSSSSFSKSSIYENDKEEFGFWKQSINVPALRKLFKVFIDPSILQPTFEVDRLTDLDFDALKNDRNIAAVVYGGWTKLSNISCGSYTALSLSIYLSIYLSVYLSIYLSIYPSIYLSIYLSIHLSIGISIRRRTHLSFLHKCV